LQENGVREKKRKKRGDGAANVFSTAKTARRKAKLCTVVAFAFRPSGAALQKYYAGGVVRSWKMKLL
jgi:hypothetical protein